MDLQALTAQAQADIEAASTLDALDQVRVSYLGKKGELTSLLKTLGSLPAEERKSAGQDINRAKQHVQQAIETRKSALQSEALETKLASERIDVTLTGRGQSAGGLHPVTRTMERIDALFSQHGFAIEQGPEIEDD